MLRSLGVDRETVLDDYELTSRYRGAEHVPAVVDLFVAKGITRRAAEGMLNAPRWSMAEALHLLDANYGGIQSYLLAHGAMTEAALSSLAERLAT